MSRTMTDPGSLVSLLNEKMEPCDLPPGFRFHPTDEELIRDYLTPKALDNNFRAWAISEVDLNKCEPWDLKERARVGEKELYFFTLRDRKYPTGMRTNRATEAGYWKATGKDRDVISSRSGSLVGMKKTLVFYMGRAPRGEKTNWIMHEYRLEDESGEFETSKFSAKEAEWVVCRIFQKMPGGKKAVLRTPNYIYNTILDMQSSLPALLESPVPDTAASYSEDAGMGDSGPDFQAGHQLSMIANNKVGSCERRLYTARSKFASSWNFLKESSRTPLPHIILPLKHSCIGSAFDDAGDIAVAMMNHSSANFFDIYNENGSKASNQAAMSSISDLPAKLSSQIFNMLQDSGSYGSNSRMRQIRKESESDQLYNSIKASNVEQLLYLGDIPHEREDLRQCKMEPYVLGPLNEEVGNSQTKKYDDSEWIGKSNTSDYDKSKTRLLHVSNPSGCDILSSGDSMNDLEYDFPAGVASGSGGIDLDYLWG